MQLVFFIYIRKKYSVRFKIKNKQSKNQSKHKSEPSKQAIKRRKSKNTIMFRQPISKYKNVNAKIVKKEVNPKD